MFNGTSMFQSLSMIKKYIIPVNGVKVTIVWFLKECKENNVSSFLYNSLLATTYTCWNEGRKREIFNLINRLFERN